jgi:hypothetical protein
MRPSLMIYFNVYVCTGPHAVEAPVEEPAKNCNLGLFRLVKPTGVHRCIYFMSGKLFRTCP